MTVTVRVAPLPPTTMFAFGTSVRLAELPLTVRVPAAVSASPTVKLSGPTATPTPADAEEVRATWRANETLPAYVGKVLDAMPASTHPMTQFSAGILAMQTESIFAKRYREGDFSRPVRDPGRDEISVVANVLDETARKLG